MSKAAKKRPSFTPRGKQVLQWSLLMIGVGFYLRDAPLMLVGLFVVCLMVVCYILCWRNFRGVQLRRDTPGEVFAGDSFTVFLYVKRGLGRPVFCISLKDFFLPEKKSNFLIPVVGTDWQRFGQIRMSLSKRGVYKEKKYLIRSDFPLGLFSIEKRIMAEVGVTVYPEPLPFNDQMDLMKGHDKEAEREFSLGRFSYGSFRGLREFSSGDPMKLVSWRASARSETLMVRDLEPPEPERFIVVFQAIKVKNVMPDSKQYEKCLKILSGLFMYLKSHNIGFEFYSSINDWQPVVCDNPAEIPATALALLAGAKFGNPDSLSEVKEILSEIPSHYHCIVVGASKMSSWLAKMPETSCTMSCMDSHNMSNSGGVLV